MRAPQPARACANRPLNVLSLSIRVRLSHVQLAEISEEAMEACKRAFIAAQESAISYAAAAAAKAQARQIHVLVAEAGYGVLSNQEKMAAALQTLKFRRQKTKKANRVIVQADQVRRERRRGRAQTLACSRMLSHALLT